MVAYHAIYTVKETGSRRIKQVNGELNATMALPFNYCVFLQYAHGVDASSLLSVSYGTGFE